MIKRSIFLFVTAMALSIGAIFYGCIFVESQTSEAILTEETITGDRKAAEGLTVGFRADAGDDLHWSNSYDYSSGESKSVFERGEILEVVEPSIYDDIRIDETFGSDLTKMVKTSLYDDIRFTGWSTVPFTTKLSYDGLEDLQQKEIHTFYDELQQEVMESGRTEKGKIRVKDYLDYYPVSFRFRLGTKRLDSGSALTGLKVYDSQGMLCAENSAAYDEDVALYAALNRVFTIPVIDNEYQEYTVSKVENHDPETSLGYSIEMRKPSGAEEDYYEFDPIMVIQEEGRQETKNRMLFIVNNRTAKGESVDVSYISGGYGIYELPIEVDSKTIEIGPRVVSVPDLTPLPDRMEMIYPLDETAEYVEMSLSDDHRFLAVFSVKDGRYFVDMINAEIWSSQGPMEMFPASEEMTYAWGEDGSLAVTNHQGYVAILCRDDEEDMLRNSDPQEDGAYRLIYSGKPETCFGKPEDDFCEVFFNTEMIQKKNSYVKYQYGIDNGLAVAEQDGKIALVQNQLARLSDSNIRTASLECAVIDETGIIYIGRLSNNLVDLNDDMRSAAYSTVESLKREDRKRKAMNRMIQPVIGEIWVEW